jgi:putative flippase GtrA
VHNFIWLRFWAWGDRNENGHRPPFLSQLLLYNAATGLVDLVVNVSILWLLYKVFGVHYLLANIAGMIMGPVFKYWLNDKIVFKEVR